MSPAGMFALIGMITAALAWRAIRRGRSIWRVMPALYAFLGVVALTSGDVRLTGDPALAAPGFDASLPWPAQAGLGVLVGAVLFGATRVFVAIVSPRWPLFARHTEAEYAQRTRVTLTAAIAWSLLSLVGEELFWRGLVQTEAAASSTALGAAAFAWLAYVVANFPSASLPVVAGAVVAGAAWAGLPLVTGGILASMCCHAVWTTLMLVLPPRAGRAMMTP